MLLSTPPLSFWYYTGSIGSNHLIYGFSAATGTVIALCCISYIFRCILGEIAYCQITQTVRLSHLDFFGRRHDLEVHADKIVPYSDSRSLGALQKLEVVDFDEVFYYSLRYGRIINMEQFRKVIGYY